MTVHMQDDLSSKPKSTINDKNLPNQVVSSIEYKDIDVHLDGCADIYHSLKNQEMAGVKNDVTPNIEIPAKESKEAILNMIDLIECFDELWPPEKSITDTTSEINPSKSHVKVLDEGKIK